MTTNNTPRTIKATITALVERFGSANGMGAGCRGIDGMREPEIAAYFGLDVELTYKALSRMAKKGLAVYDKTGRLGCVGWYRTIKGATYAIDPALAENLDDVAAFELSCG